MEAMTFTASLVPGSFHGRLFPAASLHIVHSSYAIHWLSQAPEEVCDRSSPAWNGGGILYCDARHEVLEAYASQFARDMSKFLSARAEEIVEGGLLLLLIPARSDGPLRSESSRAMPLMALQSCLFDLVREGRIQKEKAETFNLPLYFPSPAEVETAVKADGSFRVVRMDSIPLSAALKDIAQSPEVVSRHIRSTLEGLLAEQFGNEIQDEIFSLLQQRLPPVPPDSRLRVTMDLFLALKRAC